MLTEKKTPTKTIRPVATARTVIGLLRDAYRAMESEDTEACTTDVLGLSVDCSNENLYSPQMVELRNNK